MQITPEHNAKMAKMLFSSVYPHYVTKVERKGRTKKELHEVITWLTGFSEKQITKFVDDGASFKELFEKCTLNPNAHLITGTICGYKIQDIENPLTRKIRYMDKLVDELAQGKSMEKILRTK